MNCYFYSTRVVVQLHRAAGDCYFWPSGSFIDVKLLLSLLEMKVSYSVWRNLLLEHLLHACKYWFLFFWDYLRFYFSRMFISFFFFRVWKVSTCLERYYISAQSYHILEIDLWLKRLILEWSKKTNINYILFYEKYSQRVGSWMSGEVSMLFWVNGYLLLVSKSFFLYFKDLPILCC